MARQHFRAVDSVAGSGVAHCRTAGHIQIASALGGLGVNRLVDGSKLCGERLAVKVQQLLGDPKGVIGQGPQIALGLSDDPRPLEPGEAPDGPVPMPVAPMGHTQPRR